MAIFELFQGMMPKPENAAQVAAVPYDVVNTEEAAELAKGNPLSFLRVSRPEIEMEPGIDLHSDPVYAKAVFNFRRLIAEAPLEYDPQPNLYVYSLKMDGRTQVGIVGGASADDYDNNVIKKHEKTRKDKEDDRARHVMELRSHTGPVFLTYRDNEKINAIVKDICTETPYYSFVAPDGIEHKLWKTGTERGRKISELFRKEVPCMYIADGHHRAASASRAKAQCMARNPMHSGAEDYNFFLAVTFPASELKILPYNRVVKDLNGMTAEAFLAKLEEKFTVEKTSDPAPAKSGTFRMYLGKQWYALAPKFNTADLGVIERLDVSVLQDNVLAPLLGIGDPRTDKRIDFVGGIRGTGELERLVDGGKAEVAFSMYATTLDQLMDIADAGEIMPPKSTWFEPKLRDGLVVHNFKC
ncbi:MAG: DUF1015 domain-containing protein [Lentisphaeria bacterium]|nr:DUF1015 domain-containing protein [Lentisphaeria bacterium]MBQ7404708.1 DUF1015 domain-containing protein [Lentisphaeria bacterium]